MPLSGGLQHSIEPWANGHARAVVLGWGVLLPLGALVARGFKITRRHAWGGWSLVLLGRLQMQPAWRAAANAAPRA